MLQKASLSFVEDSKLILNMKVSSPEQQWREGALQTAHRVMKIVSDIEAENNTNDLRDYEDLKFTKKFILSLYSAENSGTISKELKYYAIRSWIHMHLNRAIMPSRTVENQLNFEIFNTRN